MLGTVPTGATHRASSQRERQSDIAVIDVSIRVMDKGSHVQPVGPCMITDECDLRPGAFS